MFLLQIYTYIFILYCDVTYKTRECNSMVNITLITNYKGPFRIQSNIYEGAYLLDWSLNTPLKYVMDYMNTTQNAYHSSVYNVLSCNINATLIIVFNEVSAPSRGITPLFQPDDPRNLQIYQSFTFRPSSLHKTKNFRTLSFILNNPSGSRMNLSPSFPRSCFPCCLSPLKIKTVVS